VITIKVKVISNFYDSTAGNILRSIGDILEVTEERFKVLDEYKFVEKIENKKNEILDKLEQIKKDYKVHEFMNLLRAGLITADKVKEMMQYTKVMKSETDRQILLNVIRNYLGGL